MWETFSLRDKIQTRWHSKTPTDSTWRATRAWTVRNYSFPSTFYGHRARTLSKLGWPLHVYRHEEINIHEIEENLVTSRNTMKIGKNRQDEMEGKIIRNQKGGNPIDDVMIGLPSFEKLILTFKITTIWSKRWMRKLFYNRSWTESVWELKRSPQSVWVFT